MKRSKEPTARSAGTCQALAQGRAGMTSVTKTRQARKRFGSPIAYMLAVGGIVPATVLCACGDDAGLGSVFVPAGNPNDGPDFGPPSPIRTGVELSYQITTTLRRTTASSGQGLTVGEAQASGMLCLKITDVRDTATPAYATAPQTVVVASGKVSGPAGGPTLAFHDQDDANASPQQIDAHLAPLWVKGMTFPIAGHGLETPQAREFATQEGPRDGATLSALPFFEVRPLDDDRGHYWSGWEYRTDMDGAPNMLGRMISSFADPTSVVTTTTTPPLNCGDFTDAVTCGRSNCTWATPPGGNAAQCLRLYTARFVWREILSRPAELAGDVLHRVEVMYDTDGVLHSLSEIIVPDPAPDGRIPSDVTSCSSRCLYGAVESVGPWRPGGTSVPCVF